MPVRKSAEASAGYDIYPSFPLQEGVIFHQFQSLAQHIKSHKTVIIDGYIGVLWDDVKQHLQEAIENLEVETCWVDVSLAFKPHVEIEKLVAPFLGGDDPLFGSRTDLHLTDFFNPGKLKKIASCHPEFITIIYGCGSFLTGAQGLNIYLDVPKNEIQYRSRAGSVANLGCSIAQDPKKMYKRFYFVDWIVLNRHKEQFIDHVDVFADAQRPGEITWADGNSVRVTFDAMSVNYFRVRPWFEPGTWGGEWIKNHIPGLNPDVPNYAWSFELISPENGLILESDGNLLELSFDWLMYHNASQVLGHCHQRFGNEFPIRFDFLDTFSGGNLSVQCHPGKEYMKTNFGEDFTQEETYYILDAAPDASVFLGFVDNIDPGEFRKALDTSALEQSPIEIEKYAQKHPSKKHDHFLIPPGTIHASGVNNLVLEISSTPYIFTFKLYDWMRPDLDGIPRQLNIARGMENLHFEYSGDFVTNELIVKPVLLNEGRDWKLWHLPTHPGHLFSVNRYEFTREITIANDGRCHVLSLVEGSAIIVYTKAGMTQRFCYAETFVIPAAAGSYRVINESPELAMLVMAFVK